jgi:hypothetical protein
MLMECCFTGACSHVFKIYTEYGIFGVAEFELMHSRWKSIALAREYSDSFNRFNHKMSHTKAAEVRTILFIDSCAHFYSFFRLLF